MLLRLSYSHLNIRFLFMYLFIYCLLTPDEQIHQYIICANQIFVQFYNSETFIQFTFSFSILLSRKAYDVSFRLAYS